MGILTKQIETLSLNQTLLIEKIKKILEKFSTKDLTHFLTSESPQVAAFIFSLLSSQKSSELIKKIDANFREELLLRVAKLNPIDDETLFIILEIVIQKSKYNLSKLFNKKK